VCIISLDREAIEGLHAGWTASRWEDLMAVVSVDSRVLAQIQSPVDSVGLRLGQSLAREGLDSLHAALTEAREAVAPPAAQAVPKKKRVGAPIIALLAVGGAGVAIPAWIDRGVYANAAVAVAGISVFAGIYAGAQVIERLLEPLSHWILPAEDSGEDYGTAVEEADNNIREWAANATNQGKKSAAEAAMETMAEKKNALDERKEDRAALFWAIASVVGMLASAQFGLFLLKLIGVSSSYAWDVFATGLILGSGSKPVHDLVTKVSKSSSAEASTGGSATTAG
jgi:hypothetical protein